MEKRDMMALLLGVGDNWPSKGHGMVCSYIHDAEWEVPLHKIVTRKHVPSHAFLLVNPKIKPFIQKHLRPIYKYSPLYDALGTRIRSIVAGTEMFIDYDELGKALGLPNLGEEIKQPRDHVMVLDGSNLGTDIFRFYQVDGIPANLVYDRYAFAGGNTTIGTGQPYATFNAFATDVNNLTSSGQAMLQTAVTETAQSSITKALGGYSLTLTSSLDPKGNFGSVATNLISMNFNTDTQSLFNVTFTSAGAGATVNVNKLSVKHIAANPTTYQHIYVDQTATTNVTTNISDCLFNCNSHRIICVRPNNANCVHKVYNCIMANGTGGATVYAAGIFFSLAHANCVFENCTCYKFTGNTVYTAGFSNYGNIAVHLTNILCLENSFDYTYGATGISGMGNGVSSKCASSDTSGSEAGLRSIVTANEVLSTDITLTRFMRMKYGGVCYNGGAAPSLAGNTIGVRSNARPWATSTYSVGADEFSGYSKGVPAGIF
jgi:hypothetical protein